MGISKQPLRASSTVFRQRANRQQWRQAPIKSHLQRWRGPPFDFLTSFSFQNLPARVHTQRCLFLGAWSRTLRSRSAPSPWTSSRLCKNCAWKGYRWSTWKVRAVSCRCGWRRFGQRRLAPESWVDEGETLLPVWETRPGGCLGDRFDPSEICGRRLRVHAWVHDMSFVVLTDVGKSRRARPLRCVCIVRWCSSICALLCWTEDGSSCDTEYTSLVFVSYPRCLSPVDTPDPLPALQIKPRKQQACPPCGCSSSS